MLNGLSGLAWLNDSVARGKYIFPVEMCRMLIEVTSEDDRKCWKNV